MNIRSATQEDIPAIVTLLKQSLGESLMPKSEAYWLWKHVNNPFGTSPVLLAEDNGALIGVRAFMRWKWNSGNEILSAVRAVDTATHPDHQGKGIFKKLTLSLLDQCSKEGVHFVFNTPNSSSKPGYLKMGWEETGRLPVTVSVRRPLSMLRKIIKPAEEQEQTVTGKLSYWLDHPGLPQLTEIVMSEQERIATQLTPAYLTWRYREVPVVRYTAIGSEAGGKLTAVLFGRIKATRLGREFRITDFLASSGVRNKEIVRQLKDFIRINDVDYCSVSGFVSPQAKSMLQGMFFLPKIHFGPIVTCRRVNFAEMHRLNNFAGWSPSLGDLELF